MDRELILDEVIGAEIVTITVSVARDIACSNEALELAIDQAQGDVFMGAKNRSYLLIEIIKDDRATSDEP